MKAIKQIKSLSLSALMLVGISCSIPSKYGNGIFAEMNTSKGTMVLQLFYKQTPITVANFITLSEGTNSNVSDSLKGKPYYNDIIFHRVIKDFVIQGGDPTGTGMGSPGYTFKDEFVDSLQHKKKGILSMANSGPTTNGSQFFITLKETPFLNGRHTVFGELVDGEAVLDSIGNTLTSKEGTTKDRPIDDIIIKSIKIIRSGEEAKSFDAVKVFKDYMNQRDKYKNQAVVEFKSQKETAKTHESGIKIYTINKGDGTKPDAGTELNVNYAGYLDDGTLFDTNWIEVARAFDKVNPAREKANAYTPMKVKYSSDIKLIAGFKEAFLKMGYGDKIRVFIPAKLGYGESGSGPIPPNSDLVFDIEIIKENQ